MNLAISFNKIKGNSVLKVQWEPNQSRYIEYK